MNIRVAFSLGLLYSYTGLGKGAIDTFIQDLVWTYVFILYIFHKYLEVRLLGHVVSACL